MEFPDVSRGRCPGRVSPPLRILRSGVSEKGILATPDVLFDSQGTLQDVREIDARILGHNGLASRRMRRRSSQ